MQKLLTNTFLILGGCYFVVTLILGYCPPTVYTMWAQKIAFWGFIFYFLRLLFFFDPPFFVEYFKINWPRTSVILVILGCIIYARFIKRLYIAAIRLYNMWPLEDVSGTSIMEKILSLFSS